MAGPAYAGDAGWRLQPFLAAGQQGDRGFSAFQLGFTVRQSQTLPGILPTRVGSSLDLAVAAVLAYEAAMTMPAAMAYSGGFTDLDDW